MLIRQSQLDQNRRQLLNLENELRQRKLISKLEVQVQLATAHYAANEMVFNKAINLLELILQTDCEKAMREPDEFRPYCPEQLCKGGSLYMIDQIDGQKISINPDILTTGLGVLGFQKEGKTCWLRHFCRNLLICNPDIKITIIDPKGAFSNMRGFSHIDLSEACFDFKPPPNTTLEVFVYELMPILANTVSLIYALDMLNQSADIALEQRRQYISKTSIDTNICLKDISEALNTIKVSGFRKSGYKDGASTGQSLIMGRNNIFSCRKGISLERMFSQNVVINARCLTDDMQCRFFITFLLYWLYQRARYTPESNKLKHIVIIDDATRFIGNPSYDFSGQSKTSSLAHVLSVLRSSSTGLVYATQLASQIDKSVLSLTRNILVIGNINGNENLKTIQGMLSLTESQKSQLTTFGKRQSLLFISGHRHPLIHGFTPKINIDEFSTSSPHKFPLDIVPWHSLTDALIKPKAQTNAEPPKTGIDCCDKLVLDCIHYPFAKANEHAAKLPSIREYEIAKNSAVQEGLLIASRCGKCVYLIPSQAAFDKFGVISPYKRSSSIEHAFYVNLAADALKRTGLKVALETPIGGKGATIDLTASDKSGKMTAIEVTLSTSNLSSNASKLQGTAFNKILWLCRDSDTLKAVKGYFNKQTVLPTELICKFEYAYFGKWISQKENKNE